MEKRCKENTAIEENANENATDLYQMALKTLDKETKLNYLKAAAEKGSANANWMLFLIENQKWELIDFGANIGDYNALTKNKLYPNPEAAFLNSDAMTYIKNAAEQGHYRAALKLAQIYDKGAVENNTYSNIHKAIIYYKLAITNAEPYICCNMKRASVDAQSVISQACYALSCIYLYGTDTVVREDLAFKYMKRAAFNGLYYHMLSEYYINGIGVGANCEEAYIWALIAKARSKSILAYHNAYSKKIVGEMPSIEKLFEQVKPPLDIAQRITLQKEADRRLRIIKMRPLTDEDVSEFINQTIQENFIENHDERKITPASTLPFSKWQVQNAKDITIILNYSDHKKTMVIRHKNEDERRFNINELFRENLISLLVWHYLAEKEGKTAITYDGLTVAHKNSTRINHEIVTDFNSRFRELMDQKGNRDFKAFQWIGRIKSQRSLKAHIKIEVYM